MAGMRAVSGPVSSGVAGSRGDAATITAGQLRELVERLIAAEHHNNGDPDILIVADAGYDVPRLAFLLRDLPVQVLGRMRSDRVLRRAAPPRQPGTSGCRLAWRDRRRTGAGRSALTGPRGGGKSEGDARGSRRGCRNQGGS
jgi:hypothetical protein